MSSGDIRVTSEHQPADSSIKIESLLTLKASEGNAEDQYILGLYFDLEEKDTEKAMQCYFMSASQGYLKSKLRLCQAYVFGYEIPEELNLDDLFECTRQAAYEGEKYCQYLLACVFFEGKLVKKNYSVSFQWALRAANRGVCAAQNLLFRHYNDGLGTAVNRKMASYWLRKSQGSNNDFIELKLELQNILKEKADMCDASNKLVYASYLQGKGETYQVESLKYFMLAEKVCSPDPDKKVTCSLLKKEEDVEVKECANCCANENLKSCSRCHLVYYCGKDCQRQHWKAVGGHKNFCFLKEEHSDVILEFLSPRIEKVFFRCVICMEDEFIETKTVLKTVASSIPCGHRFHLDCLVRLHSSNSSSMKCPICRSTINFISSPESD